VTTLFISDLHLSDDHPELLDQFEAFIAQQATQAEALYILGDLFEAWIGDDCKSAAADRVAEALHALSTRGTRIYFIHGNRDFLLGQQYADRCGMILLPDPSLIDCEGKKVLITHGDLLCTDDKNYQKLRRIVHTRWIQRLFLALPLSFRETLAKALRKESMKANPHKIAALMDTTPATVAAWFQVHDLQLMVHGHTHKPAHHQVGNTHRYVLGAWDIKPIVLVYAGGQWILKEL
jgi:UDP-2,3-diacylglucosamine hydrolase